MKVKTPLWSLAYLWGEMKPVNQTDTSKETGDCLRACIASLFEIDIETIPNFTALDGDWWRKMQEWFALRNLNIQYSFESIPVGSWHIASVRSPRFKGVPHAIIYNPKCEPAHDPHPEVDDPSINSKPFGWYWIVPIDPSKEIVGIPKPD